MQFIEGKNRTQSILFPQSLDQLVAADNEVRIIDLFVESIKLEDFQFTIKVTKEGRPAYHPKDLLKIFVYGYLNHIRSSRQLEKECNRNIEVMWLLKQLTPDHNTISNFRRDNEKAIRKVFGIPLVSPNSLISSEESLLQAIAQSFGRKTQRRIILMRIK